MDSIMDSAEPEQRRQGQVYNPEENQVITNWPQTQVVQHPQPPPQGWQQNVQYVAAPTVNIGNEGAPAYYLYVQNTSNWAHKVEMASRASDFLGLSRDVARVDSNHTRRFGIPSLAVMYVDASCVDVCMPPAWTRVQRLIKPR
jgi:hypothetical protein